jgi:hypothetical protein
MNLVIRFGRLCRVLRSWTPNINALWFWDNMMGFKDLPAKEKVAEVIISILFVSFFVILVMLPDVFLLQ